MKYRWIQTLLALAAPILTFIICWPGPHGGPQFFGAVLLNSLAHLHETWLLFVLLVVPSILLLAAGVVPIHKPRIAMSSVGAAWFLALFVLLLLRIYPPAWPVVFLSAAPLLGSVGASTALAWFPRRRPQEG